MFWPCFSNQRTKGGWLLTEISILKSHPGSSPVELPFVKLRHAKAICADFFFLQIAVVS